MNSRRHREYAGLLIRKFAQMVKTGAKEKREHSYTVGENISCYNHYGEQCGNPLKN